MHLIWALRGGGAAGYTEMEEMGEQIFDRICGWFGGSGGGGGWSTSYYYSFGGGVGVYGQELMEAGAQIQ